MKIDHPIAQPVNLQFTYLPAYARFIIDNVLNEVVIEQLNFAREVKIPLLKFLDHLTEEQLVELSIQSNLEFYNFLADNDAEGQIKDSIEKWLNNQLPQIEKAQIRADDITLVNYTRKRILVNNLPKYTNDPVIIMGIIKDIDDFIVASETALFNLYTEIVNEQLNEQINLIEKINDTSPGIIYVFDLSQNKMVYANRQVKDILGYNITELDSLEDAFINTLEHPDDLPLIYEHFSAIKNISDKEIKTVRHRMKHRNGYYVWMNNYETVFKRNAEGVPTQIIGISLDIDDLQKTTEKLKKSEEQLLNAQQLAEIGSFEWDLDNNNGSCTPQLLKILGFTHDKQILDFGKFLHPADKNRVSLLTTKATEDLIKYEYETRYINHNEEKTLWIRGDVSMVEGARFVKGTIMDVTNRHKLLKQLQQSDELFKEAQALTHIGNWTWDIQTGSVEWSDELYRIYDMEPQSEVVDFKTFLNFIHPDDKENRVQLLQQSLKHKKPVEYIFKIISKNKQLKILHGKSEVRCNDEGEVLTMIGTCQDVTEKQQLIDKLQESEKLFKQAQALSHIGNWSYDLVKKEITWSDELYRIYALEPSGNVEPLHNLDKFNHPADVHHIQVQMEKSLQNGVHDFFYRIILPNNETKIIHTIGETLYNDDGAAYRMIGTAQDVTKQKMIEKELLENQTFIHKIADTTPSIILIYNLQTHRYRFVSEGLKKLLGYEANELIVGGDDFILSKIHPDDLQLVLDKSAKAGEISGTQKPENDNQILLEYQYRIKHKNGNYRWLQTYSIVFDRDNESVVENILNVSVDVTENIEKESRLLEQQRFIEHIAEASPTILYLFDLVEKKFIYINREVKEVLGYEPEEIIDLGDKVTALYLHPEDDIKNLDKYVKYNKTSGSKTMHQFEGRIKNRRGKWVWILTREIVFKRNENGKPIQVLGSALDISVRKQMEETLLHKTHQLQQSNSSLEEFAHVASHDLQEPLRKISTFADRLANTNRHVLTSDGLTFLDKIIVSTRRMQQLINDILSISIITAEQNFEVNDLENLLEEVKQTLEHKIEEKKATITSDKLPAAKVNASQFRQLVQNIISNALKFTQPNIPPVINITHKFIKNTEALNIKLQRADKYLQLKFSDNGIGFDNVFSEKIFAIFQRLNSTSSYEGTGIGLAICRKIVENHGGQIIAESQPGKGATFTIYIPA